MLEIGSIVGGKYKVLNVIGKGGMSTVYLAMNERANKQWAIKEVRKDTATNYQLVRQSLITEINMLKELSHPYLPSIVDVIEEEGRFLIVMDYIEGNTLELALSVMGAQPQEYCIDWGTQLCDVLEYLHTRKPPIIYRDLKPGNIMLRPDGTICLIDFGIAREYKQAQAGDTTYLGTKGYAAPEQFGGMGQTDARTDIYNLGATLYHLVTGQNPSLPPYEFYPIRYWNPQLSAGLEQIIMKCIQNNPDDRYSSCAEVMYDLQHYKELEKSYTRHSKASVAIFALAAVCSIVFGALSFGFHNTAKELEVKNYQLYMEEASVETSDYSAFELYAKAIELNPGKADAYIELLDSLILIDDVLTPEEDQQIRQLLIRKSGKSTVQEVLAKDDVGYAQVAYKLGIAYFYCYDEDGNKKMARKWLKTAAELGTLDEVQQQRAEKLGEIAEYYAVIGKPSKSGDEDKKFSIYWNDLCTMAEGNVAEIDNAVTALIIYKEIAGLIYDHSDDLLKAGVSYDVIKNEMNEILSHIESDILSDPNLSDRAKQLVAETQGTFAKAKTHLDLAAKKKG